MRLMGPDRGLSGGTAGEGGTLRSAYQLMLWRVRYWMFRRGLGMMCTTLTWLGGWWEVHKGRGGVQSNRRRRIRLDEALQFLEGKNVEIVIKPRRNARTDRGPPPRRSAAKTIIAHDSRLWKELARRYREYRYSSLCPVSIKPRWMSIVIDRRNSYTTYS